jgi:hypothetical protein
MDVDCCHRCFDANLSLIFRLDNSGIEAMARELPSWQVLQIVVMLLIALPPLYATYDVHGRGAIPAKEIQLITVTSDPMRDLTALGSKVAVTIESKPISNLRIAQAFLSNVGRAPILPTDYFEPIRVTVPEPWKIIAIGDGQLANFTDTKLLWQRISDREYEAKPVLINPGDQISTSVYLTNTLSEAQDSHADVNPKWTARIANLSAITVKTGKDLIAPRLGSSLGIAIMVQGWAIAFLVCAAAAYLAVYLHLILRSATIAATWRVVGVILVCSIMSFSLAEVTTDFLFSGLLSELTGGPFNLPNMAVLIVSGAMFVWFYWRGSIGRQKRRRT